jgi:uncharacterized metal-binding protein YceD (DUF177 family)
MNKVLKEFEIEIFNLSNKNYDYQFDIQSSFFAAFEESFINKGQLKVLFHMLKSDTMLQTTFVIDGKVELICDRSGEYFDYSIHTEPKLIFKFGDEFNEINEEIVVIPRNTQKLNVAQYIYEYISLEIPIKKLYPRFETPEHTDEDGFVVYSTATADENNNKQSEDIDPRWAKLKNLNKEK